jgi:hypothetical protein
MSGASLDRGSHWMSGAPLEKGSPGMSDVKRRLEMSSVLLYRRFEGGERGTARQGLFKG